MSIQWYPGHQAKAVREMQGALKQIDAVIVVLDARIPGASFNPQLDQMIQGKGKIIVLNKADLADPGRTAAWIERYKEKGYAVAETDSRSRKTAPVLKSMLREACREKIQRDKRRGIAPRPLKVMAAGIPNSGKSTLINALTGRSTAKTGNKPGVTRGEQWIRISGEISLLDTPGVLWPRIDSEETGLLLAASGCINDQILNMREIADFVLDRLKKNYCNLLDNRYKLDGTVSLTPEEILEEIAEKRCPLLKGGIPDMEKAAFILLDDFRSGRLGRITLE